jgi:hypothetical protein
VGARVQIRAFDQLLRTAKFGGIRNGRFLFNRYDNVLYCIGPRGRDTEFGTLETFLLLLDKIVQRLHVAGHIKDLIYVSSAAIRHLFDWLGIG